MNIEGFIQYLQFEKRRSACTVTAYRSDLELFANYMQEAYQITEEGEVTFQIIRSWLVDMVSHNVSMRSVNRRICALRAYFGFLYDNKKITHNPTSKITTSKFSKRLPVFVNNESMQQLFKNTETANTFQTIRDKAIIETFYATGMRLSELINLTRHSFNLEENTVKVLGKGNKERIIPFGTHLHDVIVEYMQYLNQAFSSTEIDCDNLFLTDKGKKLYPNFVYKLVHNHLAEVSTINKKSPHVLRHTFATHMLNNGADINAIKELLGHQGLAATQVYTHNSIQRLKEVYQRALPKK